ncbi:unnamed protein product [Nippostrongylus brasiliensis]|uniref:Chondroitin proteoglycan 3 n=1 Tax=Nippostrongylus brasiliensis TaxID=27835 RepID=A0A0N4Y152_NIPBR|nr:unnamed protein product [Nippostrongylus brasiliensis]
MFDGNDDSVLLASGELTSKEQDDLRRSALTPTPTVVEGSGEAQESGELLNLVWFEFEVHFAEDHDRAIEEHENAVEEQTKVEKKCNAFDICYSNDDCHGGECLGAFVGKCNCNACLDFWLCETDEACGGLKGACNTKTKMCDCSAGLREAGFPWFIDALTKFCNKKSCTNETHADACFGLPCHFGRCTCRK